MELVSYRNSIKLEITKIINGSYKAGEFLRSVK